MLSYYPMLLRHRLRQYETKNQSSGQPHPDTLVSGKIGHIWDATSNGVALHEGAIPSELLRAELRSPLFPHVPSWGTPLSLAYY